MANYLEMSTEELKEEERKLRAAYQNFKGMGLNLNMARGKAQAPHQMDPGDGPVQDHRLHRCGRAPTPATTATWRACTKPGSCLAR